MSKTQKQKLLGVLAFAALLMALLAISLPALQMKPGEIFLLQTSNPMSTSSSAPKDMNWFFIFIQFIIAVLLILLPVHILISLLTKEGRKRLLIDVLRMGLIILALMWLLKTELLILPSGESNVVQPGFAEPPGFTGELPNPPSFEANPQPWMLALIIIAAAGVVAVITLIILRLLTYRKPAERLQFQDFADNAQAALEAIEEDQIDFEDVIIRCYAEMSQTIRIENGIQRDQAMTTHEFEQELMSRGFPALPILQLTQLFERVRYGHQKTRENEKQVATQSLSEIIAFCRGQA